LLHKLTGGQKFTKLDLSQAYHQIELHPKSRKFTTINTHKGLYQYKRLTYGINSAVSIFQRAMENVLRDLPGCCVYVDDILITGETDEIHITNLYKVLDRLQECGLRLKKDKFHLMLNEITYLGFSISASGISPTKEKVKALQEAKHPTNVLELQSFIGTANFLRRFIPSFAELMSPLYDLLHKNSKWTWGTSQETAFNKIKTFLCSEVLLRHYNPEKELVVHCDASSVGVGAVLLQPGNNNNLEPLFFASSFKCSGKKLFPDREGESRYSFWCNQV
jgi:hypothetical protein